MNEPKFSVIIPTYHRNDLLRKCLECLKPGVQTFPAEEYEVIVSDDGCETTAEEMIREHYPWVKWAANSQDCKGIGSNRNNGVKYARGEWLAFTDDDCLPAVGWLSAYAEACKGEALAFEGAIHPLGDPEQDLAECPTNLTGGFCWGANMAIQRSLFEKLEGYDPNYLTYGHEDVDMKLRLIPFTTISFVPDAIVLHPVRITTLKEVIVRMPHRCASWAFHVNKHREALGYSQAFSLTIEQYKFHLLLLMRNFRAHRFQGACGELAMLIVGIPLILIYLNRFERSDKHQAV